MKYAFIEEFRLEHSVELMCRVLHVSRSGYYAHRRRGPSARAKTDAVLVSKIREHFEHSHGINGSPRIVDDLRDAGVECSKHRVARLMRQEGLVARARRRFKVTTRSRKGQRTMPDLVKRNFVAEQPDQLWTGDVTYIWTREGWLYLAIVLDVCTRAIVGWATSSENDTALIKMALSKALDGRTNDDELIFHSDRGAQYGSNAFRAMINRQKRMVSSQGIDCYDNAITETFFHSLKTEWTSFEDYETRAEAHRSLFEYIEVFYNRQRRHSSIENMSPLKFKNKILSLKRC